MNGYVLHNKESGDKNRDITLLYNLYKDELTVIKIQDNIEEVKINKEVRK